MSKFLSGRRSNLNLGISSVTENQTILQTIGKVGIGTTDAQQHSLYVVGSANITEELYVNAINVTGGSSIGADIDTRNLNVTGISTFVGVTTNQSTIFGNQLSISGLSTFVGVSTFNSDLYVGGSLYANSLSITGGSSIGADIDTRNLNVTGLSTFTDTADFNGDVDVDGHTELDNLNVSGIATIYTLNVQDGFNVYGFNSVFHDSLYVAGNLSVGGTFTTVNAQDIRVYDKDIVLGIATDAFANDITTDFSANHGGIAIASTEGSPLVNFGISGINTLPDTYKQIMWVAKDTYGIGTTDAWLFNYAVGVGSTQVPNGVRFAVSEIQFTDDEINTPNLNVSNVLNVTGLSTFAGIGTFNSDLYVGGSLYANVLSITGGSSIGADIDTRNLNVTGISTFVGVTTNQSTIFGNQLSISGLSTFAGIGTFNSDLYVGGSLYANTLSITGGSSIGADIDTRNLNVTGISTFVGISTFNNNVSIGGTLDVDGNINFNGSLFQNNEPFVASRWTAGEDNEIYRLSSVGIGTTNPTKDFDVAGDIRIRGGIYDASEDSGSFNYVIASDGVGGWGWRQVNQIGAGTVDGITVFDEENIVGAAGSITDIYFVGNNVSVAPAPGQIGVASVVVSDTPTFDTLNVIGVSTFQDNVNVTGNLVVDSRIGIGTTNPTEALTVVGNASFSGIVSATAYYGSGVNLTDLIDTISISKIEGIEIKDEGNLVGTGSTFVSFDFRGPGVVATGIGSTAFITVNASAGGEIFVQEEGVQVGGAVTTINIVGPRITATNSVGIATISVDIDYFPTGDYGDLTSVTTDSFGIPLSYAFDSLTQPPYSLTTVDLDILI